MSISQKPAVGRIVHYQSYGTPGGEYLPEPRAAIVTEIVGHQASDAYRGEDGIMGADVFPNHVVSLAVLNPTGMFFNTDVHFAETPTPGHWNWPPRA
jgi:hypothetical protein